jgi:hypothetical protein
MRKITPREEDEQIAVVQWCDIVGIPVIHVPNEGKRSPSMGAKLKRMGLRSGVPDLFIPRSRGGYHGLFVEMKVGSNNPTERQKEWIRLLNQEGYACAVCYSFEEAIEVIGSYNSKIGG